MTTTTAPPGTGLVRRLHFAATWGEGLDGFDLGVISVALPFITKRRRSGSPPSRAA